MMFRAMGMKIGRKVFDCSRSITERTLTEVGDYANLNEGAVLQAHSLEEGVFKSDYIRIGSGCSIGPGAFVHYGVTMGDHVVLDADSFLMKGEMLDSHTGWRGNPAKMVRSHGRGRRDCRRRERTTPLAEPDDAAHRGGVRRASHIGRGRTHAQRRQTRRRDGATTGAPSSISSSPRIRRTWSRAMSIRSPSRNSIPRRARARSMPASASSAS